MIALTVEEIRNSISYCGLVCKFCHFSDRCAGCKSLDNNCSKRLSPEGCFQYTCCKTKGLDGCWECAVFSCGKDMFAPEHGVRITAFVRCAKEEGVARLAEYLQRNVDRGLRYHVGNTEKGDYDNVEDEAQVFALLRTGEKS
jgi:hypothetical protein